MTDSRDLLDADRLLLYRPNRTIDQDNWCFEARCRVGNLRSFVTRVERTTDQRVAFAPDVCRTAGVLLDPRGHPEDVRLLATTLGRVAGEWRALLPMAVGALDTLVFAASSDVSGTGPVVPVRDTATWRDWLLLTAHAESVASLAFRGPARISRTTAAARLEALVAGLAEAGVPDGAAADLNDDAARMALGAGGLMATAVCAHLDGQMPAFPERLVGGVLAWLTAVRDRTPYPLERDFVTLVLTPAVSELERRQLRAAAHDTSRHSGRTRAL